MSYRCILADDGNKQQELLMSLFSNQSNERIGNVLHIVLAVPFGLSVVMIAIRLAFALA